MESLSSHCPFIAFSSVGLFRSLKPAAETTCSRARERSYEFRSADLWVMGPARFQCSTLLLDITTVVEHLSNIILGTQE